MFTPLRCVGALVAAEWSFIVMGALVYFQIADFSKLGITGITTEFISMDVLVHCQIAISNKLGIADFTAIWSFIRVVVQFMTL